MGGYVAMNFLRRHADRVRGLLLANTKASADPPEAAENRRRIADIVEQDGTSEVLLTEVFPKLLSDSADPDVVRHVEALVRQAPPNAVAWAQRAMSVRPDSFDVLASLSIPVLVIAGERDALTPVTEAEAMATATADCELVVLPGVGHLSAMQAPREFNAAVSGLLKRV
jgi:pimeloyl-ACP methyl ester carboxylesterase